MESIKGIVDIRLKRDQALGWKGVATVNLQQHAYTLNENNVSATYKTQKVVYAVRAGFTTGNTIRRYEALQHQANTNIMATNTGWKTGTRNYNIQVGADYRIRKDQQLEFSLRTYQVNRDLTLLNTLHTTDSSGKHLVFNTGSINHSLPKQHNYGVNLNYSGRFGKPNWTYWAPS